MAEVAWDYLDANRNINGWLGIDVQIEADSLPKYYKKLPCHSRRIFLFSRFLRIYLYLYFLYSTYPQTFSPLSFKHTHTNLIRSLDNPQSYITQATRIPISNMRSFVFTACVFALLQTSLAAPSVSFTTNVIACCDIGSSSHTLTDGHSSYSRTSRPASTLPPRPRLPKL